MKKNIRYTKLSSITLIVLLITTLKVQAQYIGLEKEIPKGWSTSEGSEVSISTRHYKLGESSLRWNWTKGATLYINDLPNINTALNVGNGGMRLWIYNEKAEDSKLVFELGNNEKEAYRFEYFINFKGWRACWIKFNDMTGDGAEELNYIKVHAPDNVASGNLYFDRMIFPSEALERRMTPDAQLPYINPNAQYNHWTASWYWYSTFKHDLPLPEAVTEEDKQALQLMRERIIDNYKGECPDKVEIERIKRTFDTFNIRKKDGVISGKSFVHKDEYEDDSGDVRMEHIGKCLLDLATIHFHTKDEEAKQMFFDLIDYVMDQGLNVASGFGTNHHYGYQFREYAPAIFLMRQALLESGRLHKVAAMLNYWTGIQEYREKPVVGELQGVVDSWNTKVNPRFISIMTMEDTPEKIRELQAIKRWMDISLKLVPGTVGGIKADGTGFHHGGLYPAYCKGGYAGIGQFIQYVNNTPFQLSNEARQNFGGALLCMRSYSNLYDWGFGICGRHPLGGSIASLKNIKSNKLINTFAYLAKGGKPYSQDTIWKEMAEAYMRLATDNSPLKQEFAHLGIQAEAAPDGNYTYNYGALGIHRRGRWMVTMRGYNENVWGVEIYKKDNRYGRYQSYGTVQVMGNAQSLTSEGSGFSQEGWDWNRFPGATSIHLPFDKLESPNKVSLMAKSKETFAGASNLSGENGIFGMKLRETGRPNHTGDHRANKSVFCFNDRIICLGSNISNSNSDYLTETTLFQLALKDENEAIFISKHKEKVGVQYETSFEKSDDRYLIDQFSNAYWVRQGQDLKLSKKEQSSFHNKTKKPTKGRFVTAWIDHGAAPANDSYEYVILPSSSEQKAKAFDKAMRKPSKAPYLVLAQDSLNHIVWDRETNTTGFVFFEANKKVKHPLVSSISYPSLLMMQALHKGKKQKVSLCNPDLNFGELGYTTKNASRKKVVSLTLKGHWMEEEDNKNVEIEYDGELSLINFTLQHGQPEEIIIQKKGN